MSPKRFFKNIKKNKKTNGGKSESPSNSRFFPEFFMRFSIPKLTHVGFFKLYQESLKILVVFISVLTLIIVGLDIQTNIQAKQTIDLERENLVKQLNFWDNFISKHQDYRDAYFQASILEYRLGDLSKAKEYAEKGLSLDPNSEEGRKIEAFLSSK